MAYSTITSDKSKKKAFTFCAWGGWFGLHHYYVGNIGKGILYSCTFGLGGIGWFSDLIKIHTGSFRDNTGVPLRG
jgi:restriction system protein